MDSLYSFVRTLFLFRAAPPLGERACFARGDAPRAPEEKKGKTARQASLCKSGLRNDIARDSCVRARAPSRRRSLCYKRYLLRAAPDDICRIGKSLGERAKDGSSLMKR